jgi:hypothetical protein
MQEHFFAVPEPGKLAAKINWRINKPNGDFIERSTIQVRCGACMQAMCTRSHASCKQLCFFTWFAAIAHDGCI